MADCLPVCKCTIFITDSVTVCLNALVTHSMIVLMYTSPTQWLSAWFYIRITDSVAVSLIVYTYHRLNGWLTVLITGSTLDWLTLWLPAELPACIGVVNNGIDKWVAYCIGIADWVLTAEVAEWLTVLMLLTEWVTVLMLLTECWLCWCCWVLTVLMLLSKWLTVLMLLPQRVTDCADVVHWVTDCADAAVSVSDWLCWCCWLSNWMYWSVADWAVLTP